MSTIQARTASPELINLVASLKQKRAAQDGLGTGDSSSVGLAPKFQSSFASSKYAASISAASSFGADSIPSAPTTAVVSEGAPPTIGPLGRYARNRVEADQVQRLNLVA